jgi:hypothetical protein
VRVETQALAARTPVRARLAGRERMPRAVARARVDRAA